MRDPYEVLGISRRASQDEIKRAFRKLAREIHPDSDPDNPWAEDEFKELNAAYDLLSDPDKRAAFDRGEIDPLGNKRGRRRAAGAGTGARGKRPFEQFFRQREKRQRSGIKVKGADVEYALKIDFLDAARGTTKRVGMTTGKHLDVRVPPGTRDGQMLRLKGQGMPGIGGGGAGDALVEIAVEPHPHFRLEGQDVHSDLSVSVPEAVSGAKVETPTIDGTVSITVPAGSNTGTVLRLRGKGIENGNGSHGDHYVTLQVVLPPTSDAEFRAFVEKWAAKSSYDVRPKKATAD